LFGTSVGVFALSIPNRYLPILQEGEITPESSAVDNRTVRIGPPTYSEVSERR